MPKVWKCSVDAKGKDDSHNFTMAIRIMGNRHYGLSTPRQKTGKVLTSCNQLLHKMGRSKGIVNNHGSRDLELRVEEYSVQVQHTKDDHFR